MRRLFDFVERPDFPPRYNIAPTQPIPIVRAASRDGAVERHFGLARWAFLPAFAKDPKDFPLIVNARADGIRDKASFRNAVRRRRCLVPADAFYEWRRTGSGTTASSQPYLLRRTDGKPLAFAGLWETWHGPNGEEVDTACIITTGANGVCAAIHPRLPAIIPPSAFAAWLNPDEDGADEALSLLRPPPDDALSFTPIRDAINKVANDGPEVMKPVAAPAATTGVPAAQPSLF